MADTQADPVFQIQRVYLKEISLEQPNSPAILVEDGQPQVDIQLSVGSELVAQDMFEATVTATVHTKLGERTVFLVEAKQAGIFEIRNLPADHMGQLLGITCPQIIFPYLRGNIADTVQRAGFPAVHLAEINFQRLYEQQLEQAANAMA